MEEEKYRIIIKKEFKDSTIQNIEFLLENQPKYADRFINELPETLEQIVSNPKHYPIESYLKDQNENYRSFNDRNRIIAEDIKNSTTNEKRFMKKKTNYKKAPKDIASAIESSIIIDDFLPKPEDLVFKEETVRVTINLSKTSIEFFKGFRVL